MELNVFQLMVIYDLLKTISGNFGLAFCCDFVPQMKIVAHYHNVAGS